MTKKTIKLGTIAVALCVGLSARTACQAQEGVWEIGPRTLPASSGVSDVLRKALLATPTPDVEAVQSVVLETTAQWQAWVRERDAKATTGARALAKSLNVDVKQATIGGVIVYRVTPPEVDDQHQNHVLVYVHGGGWVLNGGEAGTTEPIVIAARLKMPVISIDYRMPPRDPAPAATDDVIAVWQALLKNHHPSLMAMGGTSAGGNITLSSVLRLKEMKLPVPGALYLGTPAVDVDMTGDSRFLNEGVDRLLVSWKHLPHDAGALYAEKLGPKHPHVSPIFGDFEGFPPSYLISGTRDLMLSDTVRAHRKLRRAGVEADLHVYEGQSHGDYVVLLNAPESAEHYSELNSFLLQHLKQ